MRPVEVKMSVAEDEVAVDMKLETNLEFRGTLVDYYVGTGVPSADLGQDGDIYVVTV